MATRLQFGPSLQHPHGVVPDDAPALVEWVTVSEAAELMGLTRQMVHRMAQSGYFHSLHRLGSESESKRPIFVMRRSEVMQEAARRGDVTARLAERVARMRSALKEEVDV